MPGWLRRRAYSHNLHNKPQDREHTHTTSDRSTNQMEQQKPVCLTSTLYRAHTRQNSKHNTRSRTKTTPRVGRDKQPHAVAPYSLCQDTWTWLCTQKRTHNSCPFSAKTPQAACIKCTCNRTNIDTHTNIYQQPLKQYGTSPSTPALCHKPKLCTL